MTVKQTNPKDAVGIRKLAMSVLPTAVVLEAAVAMLEGARKYGRHNYRVGGARYSVYYDAAQRHLNAWWDYSEDIDPDSGLSHVTKAIASLVVLRDAMIQGKVVDDRPPPAPTSHLKALQGMVDTIFEKYPEALPAHIRNQSEPKP